MTELELFSSLARRVDLHQVDQGIAAGVVDADGTRFFKHGDTERGGLLVDEDTVFQIGSITKTFTSLLLLRLVQQGIISLEDPVERFFDRTELRIPAEGDRKIRLIDLSTHTSGLPRLPTNMRPATLEDPYADYTFVQLASFLSSYTLPRAIGASFEYSNVGGGLLGLALGRALNCSFETALREEVLAPLQLTDTGCQLSESMRGRLCPGHTAQHERQRPWDFGILQGAGGLFSTARGLSHFLEKGLHGCGSWLEILFATAREIRASSDANHHIGLGWMLTSSREGIVVWHNGATGGYRSFIGYRPDTRRGVVLLSNTCSQGIDALGMEFLRS